MYLLSYFCCGGKEYKLDVIELIITNCDTMQHKDIAQSCCAVTDIVICKGLAYTTHIYRLIQLLKRPRAEFFYPL